MATSFDVCVIGHVSRDINAIGGSKLTERAARVLLDDGLSQARAAHGSGDPGRRARRAVAARADRRRRQRVQSADRGDDHVPNIYPVPQNLDLRVQRVDACAGTIAAGALPDLVPASGTSGRSPRLTSS